MVDVIRITRRYNINNYGFRILFKLTDRDTGEPRDVTGYTATLNMWIPGKASYYLSGTCSIYDADKGEVTYLVQRGDFADVGTYYAQIQLTKTGIVEDSELFEVILQGTPRACPPSIDYESLGIGIEIIPDSHTYATPIVVDGDVPLTIGLDGEINLDYSEVGTVPVEISMSGDVTYKELYKNEYSVLLDGSNEYVSIPNSSSWYFEDNDFTIDMRVRFTSLTGVHTLIGQWSDSDKKSWILRHDTDNNRVIFSYSSDGIDENHAYFNWTPSTGVWYNANIQRDGADLNFYIDSLQQGSTYDIGTSSLYNATSDMYVGKNSSVGEYLAGNFDEISVWKYTAVSPVDLYNAGTPGDLSLLSEYDIFCMSWWRMGDDDTFPTLKDKKGIANGTMINCEAGDIVNDVP